MTARCPSCSALMEVPRLPREGDLPTSGPEAASTSPRALTPPPPPPKTGGVIWQLLEAGAELRAQDPIAAFAPAPRMDWGPSRIGFLRDRLSFRSLRPRSA